MSTLKKGTFILFIGWSIQLLAGYALKIFVAGHLGPVGYGQYGVIMSILLWIEMGAINGFSTAVQKFVADDAKNLKAILLMIGKIQLLVNAILFGLCYFNAQFIAGLFNDSQLSPLLQFALWDIWIYSFYFMFFSALNGLHRFGKQTLVISIYAISKFIFVVLLVSVMHSVKGALLANILASAAGCIPGAFLVRTAWRQSESHRLHSPALLKFAVPVAMHVITMQLLFSIDLWFVKYHLGSKAAGFYTAASDIARVPYYLFFALSSVVLPMLSRALTQKDHARIDQTIRNAVRLICLIIVPIAVLASVYSKELILLVFKSDFIAAGSILRILIWGISLCAYYYLLTTIFNADNKPQLSLLFTLGVVVLDVILNAILVPKLGTEGGALATSLALLGGVLTGSIWVYNRFNVLMPFISLVKILVAALIMGGVAWLLPAYGFYLFPAGLFLLAIYGVMLFILGEVKKSEIPGLSLIFK